jgi:hypothetical protein
MAPSQQVRPTLGKTRACRMAFATLCSAVMLGASLALTACGNQSANAAAIVNGTVISDKDVQNVAEQLNSGVQGEQKLTSGNVLMSLILAPYVSAESIRAGKSIPDTEVLKAIANVPAPSVSTVDFVRMQLALPSLDQPSKTRIVAELSKADVTVNPRYGTFDPRQIELVPISPNWIKAVPTAEPK